MFSYLVRPQIFIELIQARHCARLRVGILKEKTQTARFSFVLVFSGCAEMVCGLPSGTCG